MRGNADVYFIWLLSLLLLGGVGWLVLKKLPWLGKILVGGSVIGCLSLVGWEVFTSFGGGDTPKLHRSQAAVAYTLAQKFLGDTTERKGAVVLVFPPERAAPAAALDSFYEAFARVMTRFPSIEVREQTLEARSSAVRNGKVTVEQFSAALGSSEGVIAVVSWVGFPDGAEALSMFRDAKSRVPLYVFDPSGGTNWLSSVQSGIIRGGVVSLPEAASKETTTGPRTPNVVFMESYRLATPANVTRVVSEIQ